MAQSSQKDPRGIEGLPTSRYSLYGSKGSGRGSLSGSTRSKLNSHKSGKVQAILRSLDTGEYLQFNIEPSEQDRTYGADWPDAGVKGADVQPCEYSSTKPEIRTIRAIMTTYLESGGEFNSIEGQLAMLKKFTKKVNYRAHRLMWEQGEQSFKCVLVEASAPIDRLNTQGGALRAVNVSIQLREIN